jgi:hypothetical protein
MSDTGRYYARISPDRIAGVRSCIPSHDAAAAGLAGVGSQTPYSTDADRNHHGARSAPDFDRLMGGTWQCANQLTFRAESLAIT